MHSLRPSLNQSLVAPTTRLILGAGMWLLFNTAAIASTGPEDNACEVSNLLGGPPFPNVGSVRALIVLVRFKDENRRTWGPNDWPIDTLATRRDALPAWADSLVENVSPPSVPQIAGSLTHYFHYMSRGQLRFNGDVYDSVIVLPSIHNFGVSAFQAAGAAMDSLNAACFDFSPYTTNHVGTGSQPDTLDFLCVVFRGKTRSLSCDSTFVLDPGPNGAMGGYHSVTSCSGTTIQAIQTLYGWVSGDVSRVPSGDYPAYQPGTFACSGCPTCLVTSTNLQSHRALIAHEVGHSVLKNSAFIREANHIWDVGNWALMYSNGHGGIMHGFERTELGWASPIVIREGTNATIKLYDSVTRGGPNFSAPSAADSIMCKIIPDTTDTTQYFLLENRRASTIYTKTNVASSTYTEVRHPGSGLLITHVNTQGATSATFSPNCPPWSLKSHYLHIEPASGIWDSNYDPNPESGRSRITADYRGLNNGHYQDTWKQTTSNAFTPYTCPNTNLFNATDSLQTVYTGLSVLGITENADSSVTFSIKWNQPANATSGSVAWKGQILLPNDFTVSSGDTVSLTETSVLGRGAGNVSSTGIDTKRVELKVEASGRLRFVSLFDPSFVASSRDTSLRIGPKPGALRFRKYSVDQNNICMPPDTSTVVQAPQALAGDWYGIRIPDISSLTVGKGKIRHARAALAYEKNRFPPSLSALTGSNQFTFENDHVWLGFDRDVTVPQDTTVTVPSGWKIGFAANRDAASGGAFTALSELIVKGNIDVNGSDSVNVVTFMSDDAESTDAYKKGDWRGMILDYYAAQQRELDFTLFRDAVHGIAIQDTTWMRMNWPQFKNNLTSDIFLNQDLRIPSGRRIDLRAPTRIVTTAGTSIVDRSGGEMEKVDIFVGGGTLVTRRPGNASASDWVTFESTVRDSVHGDDWGGILVEDNGRVHIEDADIGFAVRPMYFSWSHPDSSLLLESRIHHYNEEGVVDVGNGARIEGNVIDPGTGFDDNDASNLGIHLVYSPATIIGNRIGQHVDYGIWFDGSQSFCTQTGIAQTPVKTLTIEDNVILGDGESSDISGSHGIYLAWLCQYFKGIVEEDSIAAWSGRAVRLHQCADVDFRCNQFLNNAVGMRYFRDGSKLQSFEGKVRFRQNEFKGARLRNINVEGETGLAIADSTDWANTAKNSFQKDYVAGGLNINLLLLYAGDVRADSCSWLDGSGNIITSKSAIDATNNPGIGEIDVTPWLTSEQLCSGSGAFAALEELEASDNSTESPRGFGTTDVPVEWAFNAVSELRKGKSQVLIDYGIPGPSSKRLRIMVYNISGQRVATLVDQVSTPGRYSKIWDGVGNASKASSGVYFIRLEAEGLRSMTKKVVFVR